MGPSSLSTGSAPGMWPLPCVQHHTLRPRSAGAARRLAHLGCRGRLGADDLEAMLASEGEDQRLHPRLGRPPRAPRGRGALLREVALVQRLVERRLVSLPHPLVNAAAAVEVAFAVDNRVAMSPVVADEVEAD